MRRWLGAVVLAAVLFVSGSSLAGIPMKESAKLQSKETLKTQSEEAEWTSAAVLGNTESEESEAEKLTEEMSLEDLAEGTYNLLLIGVDRRDDSWNGNSDVMILVTVNPKQETIYLTSFLRDLYADIEGIGVQKLNAACAYGGAKLCAETIRENYQVEIDNYAMVDFNSMIAIVDAFGGVEIELTEHEVEIANQYVKTMCEANGEPYEEHCITGSGWLHLDGYQAVGFMRNRYSGVGSDFGRTERQREVMMALLENMSTMGVECLDDILFDVLPTIAHDIAPLKILQLAAKLPGWMEYELKQQHIPYDDLYHSENEILIPKMEETIGRLQETIYGSGSAEN